MICYHYTSAENYEKIRIEGLIPYQIEKPELAPFFPEGIRGVWLWADDLSETEHLGSVLWQLMTKASVSIVKLKVQCKDEDLFCLHGMRVIIDHDGRLGKWDYHRKIPAVVLTKTVPPCDIEVIGEYELLERVK